MFGYNDDDIISNITSIEDLNNHLYENATIITVSQEYAVFHKRTTANGELTTNLECNWMSELPKGFSCVKKTSTEECQDFYMKTDCSKIVFKTSKNS